MSWRFAHLWDEALTFDRFLAEATEHVQLWNGLYRTAQVPEWAVAAVQALGGKFRLVALAEDWCGDAINTIPVLAKWAEVAPGIELRILRRDAHPAVMDQYLTGTSRSIPVVVVLTDDMDELGWWGPRPRALQEFALAQRAAGRSKQEVYPEIRRWYAQDKGQSTIRELLEVMERVKDGVAAG